MDYSLSDKNIIKAFGNKVKIVTYKDIYNYETIDELLDPYGVVVILYEVKPNSGHWTILFKRNDDIIEFFDSYGAVIDSELKFIKEKYRDQLKENHTYLSYLVYKSPYELDYNPYKFQKYKNNINTCGRWVILRYALREFDIDEFYKIMKQLKRKNKKSYDELVTIIVEI